DALDYFEWALALLTCRQFVILEEAVLFWGNVLREVKAETESLFMLESEEKKHIELFKKYSRLLAEIKPDVADDLNRIKGIPRKEFLDWVLDPTQYQSLQEYHYTAWLGVLMFEEYTVWIGENLRELKDDVQPTWKQAHACHRREEVQHVRTDYAYIQQLDIRFEERSLWSKKFFQKMIRVFEDEYRELISLVEVKFPHLNAPLMLPPQGQVLTFLKHPIFRRTRSVAPYAELLCSGSEQKTDFSYLPYQNKKELTAWLQITLANLLDQNEKEISLTDSFSRLGLDSLDHLSLAAALEEKLGQVVPNNIAHEFTNIASLVEHFTDLDLEIPTKSVKQGPIEKRGETKAPVTCKQQRFLQYYDRINASANNVYFIEWFEQEINLNALKQAFAFVLSRHDSLRSVFKKQHEDFWMHILPVDSLDIQIKIYHTEAENLNSLIRDRIIKTNHPGYQVDRPPLWDLIVLKSEKTGMSAFLFVSHQLVCDGWSLEVVRKEMMEAYQAICQNHSFQKPELLFQFTDVALSQAEYLKSTEAGKRLNWWKSHPVCRKINRQNLQQVKPFLTMTDYLAFDYKTSIKKVAKQFGVTPGIFLLGIYAKVLRELEGEGFVKFRFLNRINEAERALTGYMVDELLIPRPAADLPMSDVIAHLNKDYRKALENYLPLQYLVKQLFGQEFINSRKSIAPVFNFIPFNENSSQKGQINLLTDHELYESLPWESKILYLWFARDGVGLSFHFNEEEGKEYGERLISRFLDILGDCIS
ncbi:MAG: condensation domain-containing protein, partial [Proteobacteria bacterium]|nr:condensation domain-containing protein [Pseudomonadota bacterium]